MQKLKNLIQALLEAFISFKRAYIAGQAMPKYPNFVEIGSDTETFTATDDGYVKIQKNSAGSSGYIGIRIGDYSQLNVFQMPYGSEQGGYKSVMVPVRKGETVIFTSSTETASSGYRRFFPLVGGGGLTAFCRKLFSVFGEVAYA